MLDDVAPHLIRAGLGALSGAVLGFAARRGRFCTLGAIEDAVYAGDTRRLHAWGLALAAAIFGTHLLVLGSGFDLARAIYTGPRLEWAGAAAGGLMFGLGMALVGTCGFGALLRLGGGDLKALLTVLILGISAMMAMRGLTGLARIHLLDPLAAVLPGSSQRLPALLGLDDLGGAALALVVAGVLAGASLSNAAFRNAPRLVGAASVVGTMIVAGWWATGVAGDDPFEPRRVESFSFVAPVGETLLYTMMASGLRLDFHVASVGGVLMGAFAAARLGGEFRWEAPDDAREVKRHALGAFLMGTGGVAALGCTIGQGLTGLSTLSLGSMISVAAILAGSRIGLYWLVERS
jgi:uncharacterized membrane protein YedE/YeeE